MAGKKKRLLTPKDVRDTRFNLKRSLFTRREWYDAEEVDDILDEVEYTIRNLDRDAVGRIAEASKKTCYVVVDDECHEVYEGDSAYDAVRYAKMVKEARSRLVDLVPKRMLKAFGVKC